MWTCPVCNRTFKNTNQDHSCLVTDIESHFFNKDQQVMATFEILHGKVAAIGPFTLNSVRHAILFTASSHFLAVKPKRKWLDIEFVLSRPVEGFPVHKTVQAGKYKWAHFIRLESEDEINETLVGWLREAYEISR